MGSLHGFRLRGPKGRAGSKPVIRTKITRECLLEGSTLKMSFLRYPYAEQLSSGSICSSLNYVSYDRILMGLAKIK